jgi:hypothetical protein
MPCSAYFFKPNIYMTIPQMLENCKALKRDLNVIAMDVLVDTSDEYLDLQREQMTKGMASDGGEIGFYQSKAYQFMKERMNPLAGGTVDLKLTGDFQAELTLRRLTDKKYLVYSQDSKAKSLVKKYGERIYFLNQALLDEYRANSFHPLFIDRCKMVLYGKQ